MRGVIIVCAGLSAALGSVAQGAFISFASDNDHTSYTFQGNSANITDQAPDPQVLLVDDNNGLLPALAFNVNFTSSFQIGYLGSTAMPIPGKYLHSYSLSGSFAFHDNSTNTNILTGFLQGGVLTVIGNAANLVTPTTWDDTATMQFSDAYGTVNYTWNGPDLPGYGLRTGFTSTTGDDGAFTLTGLSRANGASGVSLNSQTGLPNADWFSEGSFSGRTTIVPAPGALALCGLAAMVVGRRTR